MSQPLADDLQKKQDLVQQYLSTLLHWRVVMGELKQEQAAARRSGAPIRASLIREAETGERYLQDNAAPVRACLEEIGVSVPLELLSGEVSSKLDPFDSVHDMEHGRVAERHLVDILSTGRDRYATALRDEDKRRREKEIAMRAKRAEQAVANKQSTEGGAGARGPSPTPSVPAARLSISDRIGFAGLIVAVGLGVWAAVSWYLSTELRAMKADLHAEISQELNKDFVSDAELKLARRDDADALAKKLAALQETRSQGEIAKSDAPSCEPPNAFRQNLCIEKPYGAQEPHLLLGKVPLKPGQAPLLEAEKQRIQDFLARADPFGKWADTLTVQAVQLDNAYELLAVHVDPAAASAFCNWLKHCDSGSTLPVAFRQCKLREFSLHTSSCPGGQTAKPAASR